MSKIILKKNEDKRIKNGHLWVFSNEIDSVAEKPDNGDLVEIRDFKNQLLGSGFYNRNSLIAVRLLSNYFIDNLKELFSQRIASALNLRKTIYPHRNSFRLVFSESDFLPGLIIDKYNNTFVLQVNSIGMEKNIELIIQILKEELHAENILTKNDYHLRKLEGLSEENHVYLGSPRTEIIDDGSIKYKIDFNQSQKTGFYFDQCDNRFFIEKLANNKKVADVFCNGGGFGLHALKAGAIGVDFVDSSSRELENVKENLSLNNLDSRSNFYAKDAFDFLAEKFAENAKYHIVMIDPPAFVKSKKNLPAAEKGYEKLNRLAIQIVEDEGYLVTSSCSYHLSKENFFRTITTAGRKSNKDLQLIHFNEASLDHPQLSAMSETSYLKFAVFRVFNH